MTEPQKLQHRLAVAFQEPGQKLKEDAVEGHLSPDRTFIDFTPPLEPDPDMLASPVDPVRTGSLAYWLAGGAVVAAALAFSVIDRYDYFSVAIIAGIIGLSVLLFVVRKRLGRRNTPDVSTHFDPSPDQYKGRGMNRNHAPDGMLFGTIHDALGDITLSRTTKGVIISSNTVFREMTGIAEPDGRRCEDFGIVFSPTSAEHEHSYDVTFETKRGKRIFLWHDIITRDPVLGDLVVQSIARDVTADRQEAEKNVQARQSAEEDSSLKSQLMATVSHEIRTPLSGLLGMGYLLSNTDLSPVQQNYLQGIRESGTALVQLVEDLLDFSTLAAGGFKICPASEPIRPLVEGLVEMLSSRAHEKGIEIGTVIASNLPEILTFDAARLRQVIYNVVGNAVKFTDKGGITVFVNLQESILVVKVSDTGSGMKETETRRVFEAFEQGDLSRARESGVGLGLAISARIMAEMGGSISVESKPGVGSSFTIRMPVSVEAEAMRTGHELKNGRILLLAPVGPAAKALTLTLEGLGAEIHEASSATDGDMLLAVREHFTGIIVDHRLDKEFRERLMRNPRLKGAKRVYLVSPESRPAKMAGGTYDGWLIRPLREQSLIDVLTGKLKGLEERVADELDFPTIPAEIPLASHVNVANSQQLGLSILIAEDDPVNATISRSMLEKQGYRVCVTTSFADLKREYERTGADIILTDHSMQDGNSLDFIEDMRAREAKQGATPLPIIVLTAGVSAEMRYKLLAKGADLVLTKPPTHDMLAGAIERVTNP